MKIKFTILPLFISAMALAQVPSGYYNGTEGLTGASLKTKLSEIITNGHRDRGYDALFTGYQAGDVDRFYENDGSVLDIYSENPTGTDPYNYTFSKRCGNYSGEGSCYNREHIVPQSTLNRPQQRSDFFQVIPTDGYVNNRRSSFVFGNVQNATWTSQNGSKLGTSSVSGYGGTAFEPIDEFKGDVARILLYFVTRYERDVQNVYFDMFGNQAYPGISTWALPMLLQWNAQDPVSERERVRNNAGYDFQGNRNPFVDNPNFVNLIWGDATDPTPPTPNPPVTPPTNTSCGTETFEAMPASNSSYTTRTWTSNNITWTATRARTDLKNANSRVLTLDGRNGGKLSSSTISNGVGNIVFKTNLPYDNAGSMVLVINGVQRQTINLTKAWNTHTIENINAEGNITIELQATSGRISLDDLSWTCYSSLSTKDGGIRDAKISIVPNPVRTGEIFIANAKPETEVKIFNANGQLVQAGKLNQNGKLKLRNLTKGVYWVSVQSQTLKMVVE